MPHSKISDIGENVLVLNTELFEELAGGPLTDPTAVLHQNLERYVDYLSSALIIGDEPLRPGSDRRTHLLTDGVWTWTRAAVDYVHNMRITDLRLFARAMSQDYILRPEFVDPDYEPIRPVKNAAAAEREEHATWRD